MYIYFISKQTVIWIQILVLTKVMNKIIWNKKTFCAGCSIIKHRKRTGLTFLRRVCVYWAPKSHKKCLVPMFVLFIIVVIRHAVAMQSSSFVRAAKLCTSRELREKYQQKWRLSPLFTKFSLGGKSNFKQKKNAIRRLFELATKNVSIGPLDLIYGM